MLPGQSSKHSLLFHHLFDCLPNRILARVPDQTLASSGDHLQIKFENKRRRDIQSNGLEGQPGLALIGNTQGKEARFRHGTPHDGSF